MTGDELPQRINDARNLLAKAGWQMEDISMVIPNDHGNACPCLYGDPCQENCTCVRPMMSHGCHRCCTYGSIEQRTAAAKRIIGYPRWVSDYLQAATTAILKYGAPTMTGDATLADLIHAVAGNMQREIDTLTRTQVEFAKWPKCANCGKPADCIGEYEENTGRAAFACTDCCGHGNEDGWCEPVDRYLLLMPEMAKKNNAYRAMIEKLREEVRHPSVADGVRGKTLTEVDQLLATWP